MVAKGDGLVLDTIAMIMAGGKGSRLAPLTSHRAKPAVPFGGRYRIIDFALSNFVNSGYRRIFVLTQYMASSLIQHLSRNWHLSGIDEFIEVSPAQMRLGEHWYRGTADSVLQNLNLVRDFRPAHVAVFGGDHIYLFDISQMDRFHRDTGADVTVAAIPVPVAEAHQFGILECDQSGRIVGFDEKPARPKEMPDRPGHALVSMGNYIFRAGLLQRALLAELEEPDSTLDFGRDVIPRLIREGERVFMYDFAKNALPGRPEGAEPYWRDVGTVDGYVAANAEVRDRMPALDLYNRAWRIRTAQRDYPPARFVREAGDRTTELVDSLICEGSIIGNASLRGVLVGYDCFIHSGSTLEETVLLAGCNIGAEARVHKVLADKNCRIEEGSQIGVDPASDRSRFPFVSEGGIVVLPKATRVPAEGPITFTADMEFMLRNDPATQSLMKEFEGRYEVDPVRHSFESAGPQLRGRG